MNSKIDYQIANVAGGGTTSSGVYIDGGLLLRVITPATLTSTTMTIQASIDGVNYHTLYRDGANITIPITASRSIDLAQEQIFANHIRLVLGSAEGGARALGVLSLRY